MGVPPHLPQAGTDFEEFFDLSIDLLCIVGFDGYFKRVNASLERTLGYQKAGALLADRLRHHASGRRGAVAGGAGAARGGKRHRRLRVTRHLRRRFGPVARVEHPHDAGAGRRVRRREGCDRPPESRRGAPRGAAHARGESRRAAPARRRAGCAPARGHAGRSRDRRRTRCSPRWHGRSARCSPWTPRTSGRYDADGTIVSVAQWGGYPGVPLGTRFPSTATACPPGCCEQDARHGSTATRTPPASSRPPCGRSASAPP